MLAAENGHSGVVKLLLGSAADINAVDRDGNSALILSAANGHDETVKLLLNKEARIDAKNNKGHTALISAVKNGQKTVIKVLLGKGADISRGRLGGQERHCARSRTRHDGNHGTSQNSLMRR